MRRENPLANATAYLRSIPTIAVILFEFLVFFFASVLGIDFLKSDEAIGGILIASIGLAYLGWLPFTNNKPFVVQSVRDSVPGSEGTG